MGCMTDKGENVICPHCGLNENDLGGASPAFIKPGYVLNDRYIVGIALGQGGFGITYIGFDKVLGQRVAIKEYYPSDIAQRVPGDRTVMPFTNSDSNFEHGKQKFIDEARTLGRFSGYHGIVEVKDCFNANGTAYMVMQYLDGTDMKGYLNKRGGHLGEKESISILTPVIEALKEVHKAGVIHRDISPDNIFMTSDGQVKLIDFGAAKQAVGGQKSLSVTLKPGYAPEEQYRTRGNQGPWTDVYALTATLYKMLTGNTPPDSLDRAINDELVIPNYLSPNVQFALRKGMAVKAADRFASVEELQRALMMSGGIPNGEMPKNTSVGAQPQNRDFGANTSIRPDNRNVSQMQGGGYMPQNNMANVNSGNYSGNYSGNNSDKSKTALIIIVSILAVLVAVLIAAAAVSIAKGNSNDNQSDIRLADNTPVKEEPYRCGYFPSATASGVTVATSSNRKYGPYYATDGQCDTAWNVPGGVGQWIKLSADSPQKVKGVKILNGYTKYSDGYGMWIYYANSRPKDITISFSDGTSVAKTLEDVFDKANYIYQDVDFGGIKMTDYIKITIDSIYRGTKWNDCCITEIKPY